MKWPVAPVSAMAGEDKGGGEGTNFRAGFNLEFNLKLIGMVSVVPRS